MRKISVLFLLCICGILSLHAEEQLQEEQLQENLQNPMAPHYLYKVLSVEDWKKSQGMPLIHLTDADRDFIHLAREDQLDRIVSKYWNLVSEYVVLKIDTTKLPGKLVFEANPGGDNKYYHLYDGSIPLDAIVQSNIIKK